MDMSVFTKLGKITSQPENGGGEFTNALVKSFKFPGNAIMFLDLFE